MLEEAKADAILSSQQVAQDVHALSLLLGKVISAESITQKFSDVTSKFGKIPVNLRSETLLKRPDIRMAERQLLSANANIGAARAAFFPSISLTSNVGKISTDLNDLFESNSNSWLFMPQISVPIFTGGRHKAALDLIKVRKERRIVEYEQAIQAAFREASDALVSNEKLYQAIQAQAQVVDAARRAHRIGMLRYQEGVENYLVALDALRELYIAQRGHLLGQYQYFSNLGFLYRALGGGLEH